MLVLRHKASYCAYPYSVGSCLKRGQHSIFVIIREIKQNDTRMLDTAN